MTVKFRRTAGVGMTDGGIGDDGKVWGDGGDWRGQPGNLCEKYAQGIVAAPEAFPGAVGRRFFVWLKRVCLQGGRVWGTDHREWSA